MKRLKGRERDRERVRQNNNQNNNAAILIITPHQMLNIATLAEPGTGNSSEQEQQLLACNSVQMNVWNIFGYLSYVDKSQ